MITVRMNDAAAHLVPLSGSGGFDPPGGLAPRLRAFVGQGIVRHGRVLTWARSARGAHETAPSHDLTGWECRHSSFHLEDFVPVDSAVVDDAPVIGEGEQRVLLRQGLAAAMEVARLVRALSPPVPVRCILSANETGGHLQVPRDQGGRVLA
ncbi:hypothetical protein OUY22_25160 [Nonomuraea sp. MCN248]|uniref:Uncharacterized protein n=1 Tax=Nonomuraea corallina TaxID=2989783 RepID=A0ABT4SHW7_9ACTN|nr:hypothetical protein [Nonomuraea corallina]MDA0636715.1 hypothetical protein [Nonomuraea corallina]